MFKVNKKDANCQWRRSGNFIDNFEHFSHLVSGVSIVNFKHVIAGWVIAS